MHEIRRSGQVEGPLTTVILKSLCEKLNALVKMVLEEENHHSLKFKTLKELNDRGYRSRAARS